MAKSGEKQENYIVRRDKQYKKVDESKVMNAIKQFRGSMAGNKIKITDEEMRERLKNVNIDGQLHLYRDMRLQKVLQSRAFHYGRTVEDEISAVGYFDYSGIVKTQNRGKTIDKSIHVENIKNCINENGEVLELSKSYPMTYGYIRQIAKKNDVSIETAINQFLGVPNGTYKYIKYASIYDMNSTNFITRNPVIYSAVCDALHELTDEKGCISYLNERAPQLYNTFVQIAVRNGISIGEIVNLFLPEVEYRTPTGMPEGYTRKARALLDEQGIVDILESYNDGDGYVDAIRDNAYYFALLKRKAAEQGKNFYDYVGGFGYKLAMRYFDVDHEDYLRTMLRYKYGQAPCSISHVVTDNPQLYRRLQYFRHYYPGNVFPNMQALLEYFGYHYNSTKHSIKTINLYEIGRLVDANFERGKPITGLWKDKKVWKPIMKYCADNAISMKDLFAKLGYIYEGTGIKNIRSKLYLPAEEYEKYQKLKEQYANEAIADANKKES